MSRPLVESDAPLSGDTDPDYQGAVDALQADMARHQRLYGGGDVTATANQELAIATIERLEKEHAAQAGRIQPPVAPPPMPTPEPVQARELNGHKWTVDHKTDAPERPFRNATEFEANVMQHAMPRVKHLLSLRESGPLGSPSWHTRTVAAMYFKVRSLEAHKSGRQDLADQYDQRFMQDLYDLLEESNKTFGDWRKSEAPKLIITV